MAGSGCTKSRPPMHSVRAACGLLLLLLVLLWSALVVEASQGVAASATETTELSDTSVTRVVQMPTREALLRAINTAHTPRPTLVLFTVAAMPVAASAQARRLVDQVAHTLPTALMTFVEYVLRDTTDLALYHLLTRADVKPPCVMLFGSTLRYADVSPGLLWAAVPVFPPARYKGPWVTHDNASEAVVGLRRWLLAMSPTHYADPVSFRLSPALHLVSTKVELTRLVITHLRQAAQDEQSSVTTTERVAIAYVHLTTRGSEEVVSSLGTIGARAAGQTLICLTESRALASWAGLREFNSAVLVPLDVVRVALSGTSQRGNRSTLQGTATLQSRGDEVHYSAPLPTPDAVAAWAVEQSLVTPTLATPSSTGAQARRRLSTWATAVQQYNRSSPLIKLSGPGQLRHTLTVLQDAVKILFVLRQSDTLGFARHHAIAVELASRLRSAALLLHRAGQRPAYWAPPMRTEVLWIDAEAQPAVAAAMHVVQVPAILVLLPVQPKGDQAATAAAEAEPHMLRNPNDLQGVHLVNYFDLHHLRNDVAGIHHPQSPVEAQPSFPRSVDEMLDFISDRFFTDMLGFAMHSVQPKKLPELRDERNGGAACKPNFCYLDLDQRYYPVQRAADVSYIRDIVTGVTVLPMYDPTMHKEEEDDEADVGAVDDNAHHATAKERRRLAEWKAELERRRDARRVRVQRKADRDNAARQEGRQRLRAEVRAALGEAQRQPKPLRVARPTQGARSARARRYAAQLTTAIWLNESQRMAATFIHARTQTGDTVVIHALELTQR